MATHRGTIIAAVANGGIIGLDGRIPWYYPEDLKRFKRLTTGGTIIMGRLTWLSLPRKPLPRRRNIVLSRGIVEGADDVFGSVAEALEATTDPIWYIGGEGVFAEAMALAQAIDLVYVPDTVQPTPTQAVARFPAIDAARWRPEAEPSPLPDDPRLRQQRFVRASR